MHDHAHHHGHDHSELGEKSLHRALALTSGFMLVELVGGWWSGSLALISDSAHMLGDLVSLALSLVVLRLSRRGAEGRLSFGYQRLEILGAFVSGVALWALSGWLVYEAVSRFSSPTEVKGEIVVTVSLLGLLANLASMKALHEVSKDSLNLRAAYLHVWADALGSVGALIAGVVISLTGWSQIDPIVSFLVAGLIVVSSWGLVSKSVVILMEASPEGVDLEEVRKRLLQLQGVTEVHDLHVWQLSSGVSAVSAHLVVTLDSTGQQQLLSEATEVLSTHFDLRHSTLQLEPSGSSPSEHCHDCG